MEIEYFKTNELIPYARNARSHSDEQVGQIAASIKEFGFNSPILIKDDKTVIAGHGRLLDAGRLNIEKVPCVKLTHLDDIGARAYNLVDNQLTLNYEWDMELLKLELEELDNNLFDVDLLGFDKETLDDLLPKDEKNFDEDKQDDIPETEENEFNVERGQIWQLGDHRLMCGDSTSKADVDKLMNGEKADMVFTDPPYGVSYTKKTKEVFGTDNYTEIKNDDLKNDDLGVFFKGAFTNFASNMKDTCQYYFCSPQGGDSELMMMMMRETNIKCRHQIIWVKDAPVFSMGRLDYDYKHEPILYGWKNKHTFYRKGSQDKSVWEFKRTENKLHPTMKPVELIENAILNSSKVNNLTMDLFLGSGSTIIACEKTNRKCYGMELDEHYCSVIIKRWQEFTGKKAGLI